MGSFVKVFFYCGAAILFNAHGYATITNSIHTSTTDELNDLNYQFRTTSDFLTWDVIASDTQTDQESNDSSTENSTPRSSTSSKKSPLATSPGHQNLLALLKPIFINQNDYLGSQEKLAEPVYEAIPTPPSSPSGRRRSKGLSFDEFEEGSGWGFYRQKEIARSADSPPPLCPPPLCRSVTDEEFELNNSVIMNVSKVEVPIIHVPSPNVRFTTDDANLTAEKVSTPANPWGTFISNSFNFINPFNFSKTNTTVPCQ
jgi:hypothetical protein